MRDLANGPEHRRAVVDPPPTPARAILGVRGLHYRYPGAPQPVLHGLDFEIHEGEIFGFLGPNGSGKSTTQKLLTRILPGYQGHIEVFGDDLAGADSGYYNQVGVCFEFPNLYEKLTALENLEFYAGFFDVPTEDPSALLDRLDLPVGDRRPVGQYSKGMKMRLVVARSLMNRPRLWFLDEPTAGQDPEHAVSVRELIRERAEAGTTVFLTTHNMTVAEELCDRVAFLVAGEIAVVDAPRRLKLRHADKIARVEVRSDNGLESRDFSIGSEAGKRSFIDWIRDRDVETIHTLEPSFEDVFLEVTGRRLDG
jgi:fluoroquinolone transport system ATP-binding protein